ncbi:hypothetical protein L1987_09060 [Smallanthus sonchifolius]|uniref:Uncharacterized protein n=1 Tax=Smallanthus sonchifolius TaxID=185202 RepID=A0ACB9JMX6_9ASTR|nr:hypothetical protein L1987_09060 [Smallanthus sonchifolius]
MKAHYTLEFNHPIIKRFRDSFRILASDLALLFSWVGLWLSHLSARRYDLLSRPYFLWPNLMGRFPNLSLTRCPTSSLLVSSPCMTEYGTVSPESVVKFTPSISPIFSSSDSSSGSDSETWSGYSLTSSSSQTTGCSGACSGLADDMFL